MTFKSYIPLINLMADYFGNKYISRINYSDLSQFLETRHKKARGGKLGRSTINNYNAALKRVYEVAIRQGWIYPNQTFSFHNDGKKTTARPAFSKDEVIRLIEFMEDYSKEKTSAGVSKRTVEIREFLRDYVEFILFTGLRPGEEVKQIKWRHIKLEKDKEGKRFFRIKVPKAKTKARDAIGRPALQCCLDRLARRYCSRLDDPFEDENVDDLEALKSFVPSTFFDLANCDDYVFRLEDGSFPKDLSGAFDIMLTKVKEDFPLDEYGQKRTLYSLRHTYATLRLLDEVDIHVLAKSMGTSIKMLEQHYSHLEVWQKARMLSGDGEISSEYLGREMEGMYHDVIDIKNLMKRIIEEAPTEEFIEQELLND